MPHLQAENEGKQWDAPEVSYFIVNNQIHSLTHFFSESLLGASYVLSKVLALGIW